MSEDWRKGSMVEQNKHMLDTGLLSDCSFLVGQEPDIKEFKAHKFPLCRSSEVFQAMFFGALREKDIVRVTDVTPAAFQALLNHVYCDTLDISDVGLALGVCSAAHKYNLQPLVNKCTKYIATYMVPANVCKSLEFSNLIDCTKLQQSCIKMLQSRTDEVLSADSWCDVDVSCVVTLLQQVTLNVESELPLLMACQRWAQHQLEINNQPDVNNGENDKDMNVTLMEIAAPLLPYIRVLSLTAQQFAQSTENSSSLYSEKEQNMIFKCLLDPLKHKISEGLCEIKNARKTIFNSKAANNKISQINNKEIIDEFISHLEKKELEAVKFKLNPNSRLTVLFTPNSNSIFHISKNIVIYGFQFHTMELAKENSIFRTLVNRNEYYEKFTLQFVKSNKCVAEFQFDGELKYDDKVNFYFPKPFLAREDTEIQISLQFNYELGRKYYRYFHSSLEKLDDVFFIHHLKNWMMFLPGKTIF